MLTTTFSMLGVLVSALFVWGGGLMILGPGPWIRAVGIVSVGYGMFSVVLLIAAWLQPRPSMPRVSGYLAVLLLVALLARLSKDVETISRLEWVGIALVPILLWINWFAVKKLVESAPNVA